MDRVRVDFPGMENDELQAGGSFTLGDGSAEVSLSAGRRVVVTHRIEVWESKAEFGPGAWDSHDFAIPPIPPIPPMPGFSPELSDRIARKTEAAMRRVEEANRRIAEQARRRAEQKIRAAEQRGRLNVVVNGRRYMDFGIQSPGKAASEPVSDAERLTILKMLQEKKISLQEAEKLLAALEGK
jgi:hypothetical protein